MPCFLLARKAMLFKCPSAVFGASLAAYRVARYSTGGFARGGPRVGYGAGYHTDTTAYDNDHSTMHCNAEPHTDGRPMADIAAFLRG